MIWKMSLKLVLVKFVLFGIDCASGDTFIGQGTQQQITMSSMFVPEAVISLSKDKR